VAIEIWKQQLFKGYRKISSQLYVFIYQGSAFASWKQSPISGGKRIPVSEELAAHILDARRMPCPHEGTQPTYSLLGKPGYTCREKSSGEDCRTVEHCSVCGYLAYSDGNPRFRAAFGSGEYSVEGHPSKTYLASTQELAVLTEASWDTEKKQLTMPSGDDSSLVVWVRGSHLKIDGSYRSLRQQFPKAEHLHGWDFSRFFIFKDENRTITARR
jgi:hypothetical protein